MACAIVLGLLVALGRLSQIRALDWILQVYLEIWRNVPLIVQLLVIYFTLPEIGLTLPAFWAGVLGLTLNLAAYLSEVFRAAISAIDKGQRDAALSIGIARGAFEAARDYSKQRTAFGQPISGFQAIQFMLADMATEIDAARLLTHRAATIKDKNGKKRSFDKRDLALLYDEDSMFSKIVGRDTAERRQQGEHGASRH